MLASELSREKIRAAVPSATGTILVHGIDQAVTITRDPLGIPHIRAQSDQDAFFGQGFAHAQDRLWHMDYDRHRAYGRWAEFAGPAGVAQDRLMRRLRLAESARSDYPILLPETRATLDAYCAGVNAFLAQSACLPIEYEILGVAPEPWQPWDGLAAYMVRHVMMGVWEAKLWRARLANQVGLEKLAALYPVERPGELLILPPGATYDRPVAAALDELAETIAALTWLNEDQGGSNSWALDGSRTASGKPLLAGDPHRAVDVPNVYYQNHLAGATFDVVGLSFPGLPGFPHFGHNECVAWCVTHAMADTQDLFVEQFDPEQPRRYRFRDDWREAEVHQEAIQVRGADPVEIDVVVTHHGPVVAGDPARGHAITMRYTATLPHNRGWDCLLPMLRSRSADDLQRSMRDWVDPANNFLFADVHGTIGYRTRGQLPIRDRRNAWLPVPGWTGEHEWVGFVPFEEMPNQMNPQTGYLVTANNRIVGPDYPHYLGLHYAPDDRARRITARLQERRPYTIADMAAIHADVVSRPSSGLRSILGSVPTHSPLAAQANAILAAWDGQVHADLVAPTIYNTLREEIAAAVLRPLLGPLASEPYSMVGSAAPSLVVRLRQRVHHLIAADDRRLLPDGVSWTELIADALEQTVEVLCAKLGDDMSRWRWGELHQLRPVHPLGLVEADLAHWLNPPPTPMDGDGDTVQAAGYLPVSGFTVTGASVARYAFDLADWDRSGWVVPYGASGHPGSPHFADQAPAWQSHRLHPMHYRWDRIALVAESQQTLVPGKA